MSVQNTVADAGWRDVMSIVVDLPDEVEIRLRAAAAAEGREPASVAAEVIAAAFLDEDAIEQSQVVAEIAEALRDAHAAQARGELLTVDEAFAELDARAESRRRQRAANAIA
jgi:predicted transcriptional regulator